MATPLPQTPSAQSPSTAVENKPRGGATFDVVSMWMKGQTPIDEEDSPERHIPHSSNFPHHRHSGFTASFPNSQSSSQRSNPAIQRIQSGDWQSALQETVRAAQFNSELILEDRRLNQERMESFQKGQQEELRRFLKELNSQFEERRFEQASWLSEEKRAMEMLLEQHNGHTEKTVQAEIRALRMWLSQNLQRIQHVLAQLQTGGDKSSLPFGASGTSPSNKGETLSFDKFAEEVWAVANSNPSVDDAKMDRIASQDFTPAGTKEQTEDTHLVAARRSESAQSRIGRVYGLQQETSMVKKQIKMMGKVEDMYSTQAVHNVVRQYFGYPPLPPTKRRSIISRHLRKHSHSVPKLVRIIDSHLFSGFFFAAILANATWIAYSTDRAVDTRISVPHEEIPPAHSYISSFFTYLFIGEVLMRLGALRHQFFKRDDRHWNMFDLFVVVSGLMEELFSFADVTFLRALRIFRLVRVVRIFKILRWFSGLQMMLVTMIACLPVLIWTFMTMAFVIFLFSVLLLQGAYAILDKHDAVGWEYLSQNFSAVPEAMYTLLLSVTHAHLWYELAEQLGQIHRGLQAIFVAYIMIMMFGFFQVIIGVFVVKSMEVRENDGSLAVQKELDSSNAFVSELTSLLTSYSDDDITEYMSAEAFGEFLKSTEVQMFLQTHSIDTAEAEELFQIIFHANQHQVTIEDFVYGCQRMKGVAKAMDIVLLFEEVVGLRNSLSESRDRQNATIRDLRMSQYANLQEFQKVSALLGEVLEAQQKQNCALTH